MRRRYFIGIFLSLLIGSSTVVAQRAGTKEKIKVACVGNSITYGFGIKNRDSLSYPAQLQRMLGSDFNVRNFGVSGRTLLKKGDHPYWQEAAFQQVQQWNPDVIILMLGTNDTKPWNWKHGAAFATDYKNMLEVFKNLPARPEVWAALPVPVFHKNKYQIRDSIIKIEIPIIRKVARQQQVHILNLHRALRPYGKYFFDGVHPDKTGAYYLAKAVNKRINARGVYQNKK